MKKTKLSTFLKSGILFFGISLLLFNCSQKNEEEIISLQQNSKFIEKIPFNQLPSNLTHHFNSSKSFSKIHSKNSNETIFIHQNQIVKLVDSYKNTKFTIKFSITNQPNNILYNLILGNDENNQELQPKVIKYTIKNLDESSQNGRIDFSKIKGEISIYSFDSFIDYYNNSSSSKTYNKHDSLVPCKNATNSDSNTSDNSNTSSGDTGDTGGNSDNNYGGGAYDMPIILPPFLEQQIQYVNCNVNTWSNGETGEITYVTWSCEDGTSGVVEYEDGQPVSSKNDETPNCDSVGEAGINDDDKIFEINFDDTEKIDPKKELECFDTNKKAKLTIYVQQPKENTSEVIGPNQVGHAFIGIEQNGIVRNLGFYPNKEASEFGLAVGKNFDSEIRTNNNYMHHVSISTEISSKQLSDIIKFINNAPSTYNVNSFACVDFTISIGNLGGLNLPSTTVKMFPFEGRSPGQFGQEIRQKTSNNEVTISKSKANSPKKTGKCD